MLQLRLRSDLLFHQWPHQLRNLREDNRIKRESASKEITCDIVNVLKGVRREDILETVISHVKKYEKVDVMGKIDAQNEISAVPVLIAQYLNTVWKVELVAGNFEFMMDSEKQVWLVNVTRLMVLNNAKVCLHLHFSSEEPTRSEHLRNEVGTVPTNFFTHNI